MHVNNTHLYSPNSACAWGFLLVLYVTWPVGCFLALDPAYAYAYGPLYNKSLCSPNPIRRRWCTPEPMPMPMSLVHAYAYAYAYASK